MSSSENTVTQHIKSAGIIGVITLFSRILGLVREVVIATILGTSFLSDAFTLAFSIPDLFRRLFSEGVLANAFIPKFIAIRKREGKEAAGEFTGSMIAITGFTTGVLCLISIVFAPLLVKNTIAIGLTGSPLDSTVLLTRIMLAYVFLISITGIYQGILNSFSIFWVSSLTPALLNLSVITFALVLSPYLPNPAVGFALGVLVGGLIQFLFHLPFVYQIDLQITYRIKWNSPHVKSIGYLLLPTVFGVGIYQINILISNIIASTLQTGSVASLKFSNRLQELIIGVFVISMATVTLPGLSALSIDERLDDLRNNLKVTLSITLFLALPITIGGILLAEEIVTLLYARGKFDSYSIRLTSEAFIFHLLGLCFIACNRLFLNSFQALGLIRPLVISGAFILLINVCLALILKGPMGHKGIALATSLSQVTHAIMLVFFLRKHSLLSVKELLLTFTNLNSLLAACIMLCIVYSVKSYQIVAEDAIFLNMLILIPIGICVYVSISYILKNQAMLQLCRALLRKTGKQ